MTRSRRKHPFVPFTCSETDKWWKQMASKRLRRRVKLYLLRGWYDVVGWLKNRDLTCSYTDPKDGKMRIDPEKHPKVMRK